MAKTRGRPRKEPGKLSRWTPPKDWVRVVAWVSPDDRKALKKVAVEADTSVAELVRALGSGLAAGVVTPHELLSQVRKGMDVMEKIPTIFDRGDGFKVVDRVRAGCEWVFEGEGAATEKLDGMNVRLTVRSGQVVRVEKRRNPTKVQKAKGIVDGWYIDADEAGPQDKYIYDAAGNTDVAGWPDGEHCCEALGPKIQGNELGLDRRFCAPFNLEIPTYGQDQRNFESLRAMLESLESKFAPGNLAEGIVFHHPDGRRAKIKRKDFRY